MDLTIPTPAKVMTWIEVMKAGGPYVIILALLVGMFILAKLAHLLYTDVKNLQNNRVSDLIEINKQNSENRAELTAAITRLATLIESARRRKDSSNGSA